MQWFLFYLAAVNLIAFFAMGLDKWKACHDKWRVKERTLFLWALLGGSIGGIFGMLLFRHKTRHWYFRFGFPVILILQIALLGAVRYFLL